MSENIYVNVWNVNNINLQSNIEGPHLYHATCKHICLLYMKRENIKIAGT